MNSKYDASEKHLDAFNCTACSFHKEETEQSCGARHIFFYFNNTIVTCCEKDFQGQRELCDNLYELYVFEGRYDSFLSFGLI